MMPMQMDEKTIEELAKEMLEADMRLVFRRMEMAGEASSPQDWADVLAKGWAAEETRESMILSAKVALNFMKKRTEG